MLNRTIRCLFAVITCTTLTLQSTAQTPFNDSWVLFDQVSISGPLYSNALPRMTTMDAADDHVYLRSLTTNSRGMDTTVTDTCLFDKTFTRQYRADRYEEVVSKWTDDRKGFDVHTEIYDGTSKNNHYFTVKEKYRLEGDKMMLTIYFKNIPMGQSWECKGIFERREK
jgi:hypothetical protein